MYIMIRSIYSNRTVIHSIKALGLLYAILIEHSGIGVYVVNYFENNVSFNLIIMSTM